MMLAVVGLLNHFTPAGTVSVQSKVVAIAPLVGGRRQPQTAVGAGTGVTQRALPTRIEFQFAIESPNGYRKGHNRRPSGECRIKCGTESGFCSEAISYWDPA